MQANTIDFIYSFQLTKLCLMFKAKIILLNTIGCSFDAGRENI